jgi:hypothetical protein
MHRSSSAWVGRLPARVQPRARAWHRRGVAATFRLHDRLLSNRQSRRLHGNSRALLTDAQRWVVDLVRSEGYAVSTFDDFFAEQDWRLLMAQAVEFVDQTEEDLEQLRQRKGRNFLVRKYDYNRNNALALDDPWLRLCLSPTLLNIGNAFLDMWSKLEYVDVWYSIPVASDAERRASQAWHRDFEDSHLLKVFLYLRDVDEKTGPFEFVAGSQIGGPLAHIDPWQPTGIAVSERGTTLQDLEKRIDREVPAEQIRTFTGPARTMIFCNTTGLHRGGFAETHPRVLATLAYTSPASLAALTRRNYSLKPDTVTDTLSSESQYALR